MRKTKRPKKRTQLKRKEANITIGTITKPISPRMSWNLDVPKDQNLLWRTLMLLKKWAIPAMKTWMVNIVCKIKKFKKF
jgi:hypothetical protein